MRRRKPDQAELRRRLRKGQRRRSTGERDQEINALRRRLREGLHLTRGERLLLHRRAVSMTQRDAAAIYGVSLDVFREWEQGLRDDVPRVSGPRVAELQVRELLFVQRRRRGIGLDEIAAALDRCDSWVHQAEGGRTGVDRVVDYVLSQKVMT